MQNPKQIVCKRVLGLEGDEVQVPPSTQLGEGRIVKASHAAMPDHQVGAAELYLNGASNQTLKAILDLDNFWHYVLQVPPGHVWLQGDNTLNSTDSRHYGPVPYALIKGRAFLKVNSLPLLDC